MRRPALVLSLLGLLAGCGGDGGSKATVIGSSSVSIDTRMITVRVGEAAIGDWMADALLSDMTDLGKSVQVAFVNSGGIRGGAVDPKTFMFLTPEGKLGKIYPAGPLTDQDVLGWFPFQNDHTIETLTGTDLKSILERSVSSLPPDLQNDKGGWLLQPAGMSYTVDCSGTAQQLSSDGMSVMTEGTRVVKIVLGSNTIYDASANVDQLAQTNVVIVVNSFTAGGNDGHLAFKNGTNAETIPIESYNFGEKLVDRVKTTSPIAPATSGRITIIGNCGQPLTQP